MSRARNRRPLLENLEDRVAPASVGSVAPEDTADVSPEAGRRVREQLPGAGHTLLGTLGPIPDRIEANVTNSLEIGNVSLADIGANVLPEPVEAANPIEAEVADSLQVDNINLADYGVNVLPEPIEVEPGVWLIATGPSPEELKLNKLHNANAADTTNADQLRTGGGLGLNLDGAGLRVGVWDGGDVRSTHQEFGGRVTVKEGVGLSDHATHVAGTIGAAGVVSAARGMANAVNIDSYDWNNDVSEMAANASGLVASNHSYGQITGWTVMNWTFGGVPGNYDTWFDNYQLYGATDEDQNFGKYSGGTRDLDQALFNNPNLLSVWSAGNDRNDAYANTHGDNTWVSFFSSQFGNPGWYRISTSQITPPSQDGNGTTGFDTLSEAQNAKNSLVVGSVLDHPNDPHNSGAITTSSFSSYGPTDDGRLKPDVVGNGDALTSSIATGDSSYGISSGTSMSAPNVTGTATLLIQHYQNLFGSLPRSATTKGLLIHTATDAGNVGPDYSYGWGLVDAADAANFLTDVKAGSADVQLQQATYTGTEQTYTFNSDGTGPLKATIVWTDPAGTAHADGVDITTPVLVNDLNIWITGPSGTHRAWTLDPANPANPAVRTQDNHLDNVEQVLIDTPVAGTYTIHIGATGVVSNQAYSLLVSDVTQGPPRIPSRRPPTFSPPSRRSILTRMLPRMGFITSHPIRLVPQVPITWSMW